MDTGTKRSQRDYTLAFKLSVVDQVEKGELSYKEAQRRYGIQGRSTVLVWLRKHGRQDWSQGASIRSQRIRPMDEPTLPLTPEQRIKELEEQLALATQKAQFFEAVVDVLKNDYGVSVGKKATRQVVAQTQTLSVSRACQFMGISRQAYYKRNRVYRARADQDQQLITFVEKVRARQPCIGTRKLHSMMHEQREQQELHVGRDRLFAVLRESRQLVRRKRAYHKTTDSHHRFRRHPNLLKPSPEQIVATGPEQVWVADITYLPTRDGVAYLSLVTDVFSRKIVGYHVHESLHTNSVVQAFRMALKRRRSVQKLVHHSDRGAQYCSALYQEVHAKHGITCSMTDGYDCYQNALAERVNGILKTEFLIHRPADFAQATQMVREAVTIYNQERPHLSLKYKTPDAVHRALG
ncbi:IS3 family transposase [Pseudomonas sp. IT-P171]|uniref:IS3 family transposase n=2 Tax=unclassified Pseudomonas TaxID=196821 RepID=UPI0039E00DE8